ncbi:MULTISPECIES: thioredoxin family protein [Bacillus cereus group]|uniref:thioredoxin family protein n=1 Tax=Bacillus cereus group TaxID=86661 RepID=UPI0011EFDC0C|nr:MULTISPECIES: thioredoxin family protein [Bacillus cereus group]KAA0768158.1 thioredoxin [Bacillus sp. BB51/4]MBU4642502.1 thioredoxin family protein [Bacillus toyonensis]
MKKMIIFASICLLLFITFLIITNKENNTSSKAVTKNDYYKNKITIDQLENDISNNKEKVIYFYQTTCFHCKLVSPIIVPMAEDMNINMQVIDLETYKEGWDKFKITGTPTVIHYKKGKEIDRIEGEQEETTFRKWFKKQK